MKVEPVGGDLRGHPDAREDDAGDRADRSEIDPGRGVPPGNREPGEGRPADRAGAPPGYSVRSAVSARPVSPTACRWPAPSRAYPMRRPRWIAPTTGSSTLTGRPSRLGSLLGGGRPSGSG